MTMARVIRFILGPLFVLGGLWFMAMPFAFATMSFGDREAPPTWAEYLGEVFRGGADALGIGLVLFIVGLYLAGSGGKPDEGSEEKSP
jgi:hypothetical protein